ncbi:DUF736 domain-containing protein [bacterium]|nr:DUF736 domain-containing protein [bacterium]
MQQRQFAKAEVGAAWLKKSKKGNDYLSLRLTRAGCDLLGRLSKANDFIYLVTLPNFSKALSNAPSNTPPFLVFVVTDLPAEKRPKSFVRR